MKNFCISMLIILSASVCAFAESPSEEWRFSPQKFMKDQEAFITRRAGLTTYEAAKFFPLFHELARKKMNIENSIKKLFWQSHNSNLSEVQAKKIMNEIDKLQLEKAKLDITYHNKYRKYLSNKKIMRVLEADGQFSHEILRKMSRPRDNCDNSQK